MVLIKCRGCGKEISDKSKSCANCGVPVEIAKENRTKRVATWFRSHIVVSIIVNILIISAFIIIKENFMSPTSTASENKKDDTSNDLNIIIITGNSMFPALKTGERKLYKKTDTFNRFDIVVFKTENADILEKRIYGMPRETISINGEYIYINGKKIVEDKYAYGSTSDFDSITLKNDEYFVLGDNRENSLDSRLFGAVKKENIMGIILEDNKK